MRSTKRGKDIDPEQNLKTPAKRGKTAKTVVTKSTKYPLAKLSRSPKINKQAKGKVPNTSKAKGSRNSKTHFSQDGNNNAQPGVVDNDSIKQEMEENSQNMHESELGQPQSVEDRDHVRVNVNDSEDDLSEDEENEVEYNNPDSDCEDEEIPSDNDSGSEVVIAPQLKTCEQEFEEDVEMLVKNPTFRKMINRVFSELSNESTPPKTSTGANRVAGNVEK